MKRKIALAAALVLGSLVALRMLDSRGVEGAPQAVAPTHRLPPSQGVTPNASPVREVVAAGEANPGDSAVPSALAGPGAATTEPAPADPKSFAEKYADQGIESLDSTAKLILRDIQRLRQEIVASRLEAGDYEIRDPSQPLPTPSTPGVMVSMGGELGADSNGTPVLHHVTIEPGESEELDALQEEYAWLALKIRDLKKLGY